MKLSKKGVTNSRSDTFLSKVLAVNHESKSWYNTYAEKQTGFGKSF